MTHYVFNADKNKSNFKVFPAVIFPHFLCRFNCNTLTRVTVKCNPSSEVEIRAKEDLEFHQTYTYDDFPMWLDLEFIEKVCRWQLFRIIPKRHITADICKLAFDLYDRSFEYFPEEFKTEELCAKAIRQNGCLIEYCPEKFRTTENYEIAVRQNVFIFHRVPDQFKTREMCREPNQFKGLRKYVPYEFRE
jgi:hypothetical protein